MHKNFQDDGNEPGNFILNNSKIVSANRLGKDGIDFQLPLQIISYFRIKFKLLEKKRFPLE